MKGTTSVAPMRGCAPLCCVRSINSCALPTPRRAASATASGSPARVTTQRLWSASDSRSRIATPVTSRMAEMMASILETSRPSEKFGTHSIIFCIADDSSLPEVSISDRAFLRHYNFARINYFAALHCEHAQIYTKIIRDFPVIGHIEHGQIRKLANLKRADAGGAPERVGGVDGGGSDRFGWRHFHLRASKRHDHGHIYSWAGAGIVVGG